MSDDRTSSSEFPPFRTYVRCLACGRHVAALAIHACLGSDTMIAQIATMVGEGCPHLAEIRVGFEEPPR
jgi:hypothetical protein